jgi:hypothetical protein
LSLIVQKGKVAEEEEEEGAGRKMGSDSEFVTPGAASRKKRKLFSNTPQHSQVRLGSLLLYKGSREEGGSDSEFVTNGAASR